MNYNAFISYSHSDCGKIAPQVQKAIENIGKPWYWIGKKRLKIFRDETDVSATPELWNFTEDRLATSAYFILLASPRIVDSKWVQKEVEWWLNNRTINALIIVVVKGNIQWLQMEGVEDFDWEKTNCLPHNLKQKFTREPLYIDLRLHFSTNHRLRARASFETQMVKIIGAITGISPREIHSKELKRQNNIKRFLGALGLLLVGLLAALLVLFLNLRNVNVKIQNQLARNYWDNSQRAIAEKDILKALHYAAEAIELSRDDDLTKNILIDIEGNLPVIKLDSIFSYTGKIDSAVFSPDGRRIITQSRGNLAMAWHNEFGKGVYIFDEDGPYSRNYLTGRLKSIVFSPEGKTLVTIGYDKKACLFQVVRDPRVTRIESSIENEKGITSVIFSPDGKRFLTSCQNGTARIWEAGTGNLLGQIGPFLRYDTKISSDNLDMNNISDVVLISAMFSYDGKRILTKSIDNAVRLWDAETYKQVVSPMQHPEKVTSAIFSSNGKKILTVCTDNFVRLWDASTGNQILHIGPINQYSPKDFSAKQDFKVENNAIFSPDEKMILTLSSDKIARLWDEEGRFLGQPMYFVNNANFSRDGKRILAAGTDGAVRLMSAATGEQTGPSMRHKTSLKSAVFSPDEKKVVSASNTDIRIWKLYDEKQISLSLKDNSLVQLIKDNNGQEIESPDKKRELKIRENVAAELWQSRWAPPVDPVGQIGPSMHHTGIKSAVFSPDGKRILTAGLDGTARLWEAGTGKQIGPSMPHKSRVLSAVFHPDGKEILTRCEDGTSWIWYKEGDLDIPANLFKLQAKVITGVELNLVTNEIDVISSREWFKLKENYYREAQEHYKICQYPMYNLWSRFNLDEARKIHPEEKLMDAYGEVFSVEAVKNANALLDYNLKMLDSLDKKAFKEPQKVILAQIDNKLNNLSEKNEQINKKLLTFYGNCSWYLLFASRFEEAEESARKGLQKDASKIWIKTNLAHSLLFQGRYEEAFMIYEELKFLKDEDTKSYAKICLEDLEELRKNGISNKDVKKIREFLKNRLDNFNIISRNNFCNLSLRAATR